MYIYYKVDLIMESPVVSSMQILFFFFYMKAKFTIQFASVEVSHKDQ